MAGTTAAAVLFPKPLHLTRQIDDPISGRSHTVEQYLFGSRVVTISGDRTAIADYDRSELTEIDRGAGTYSVTSFAAIANARPHPATRSAASSAPPKLERLATDHRAGRTVERFAASDDAKGMRVEVAIDGSVLLTRDAFDVVIGAAHPNDGGTATDLARAAARRLSALSEVAESYGLPLDQTTQFRFGTNTVVARNQVTHIGDEFAPSDLVTIPPGAKQIDSIAVRTAREADRLDHLPSKVPLH